MAYTLIIAEKPSVAAGIAKVVGANTPHREKANGYLEGNGYRVTWAFGHLVGLDSPEQMGYTGGELPMIPSEWKTHILNSGKPQTKELDALVAKQMKMLESLFNGANNIVVATDAGREGELIFRYIYEYLKCRTPFDRLWISSLTDEAIRKGMSELKNGRDYDSLSEAAHARSEADWLVGYNASRALRLSTGYRGTLSLGRVQTPVLCMVCDRFNANKNFVPTPFWQIKALLHKDMENFEVWTDKRYDTEAAANEDLSKVSAAMKMRVTKVEKKQVATKPPLLFDLTALQQAANSKFGMTADETLKVAQKLYENKYLSYPRTGSRYIPEDVYKTLPSLIKKVSAYGRFTQAANDLNGKKLCKKSVNDAKVTDHHALLPTDNVPTSLEGAEKKIWELVCGRMLEAVGEDSISDKTNVSFDCNGVPFKASGSVLVKAGWKAVFGAQEAVEPAKTKKDTDDDEEEAAGRLPDLSEGEVLPVAKPEVVRKTDKPLPIYTDASLLEDMKTCGKKIEDEELKEAMKDVGLGTPATRAATIEALIKRGYIVRQSKKLTPTELGESIANIVRGRKIANVEMTGEWERELARIEKGELKKGVFDDAIKKFVLEIIDDLQKNCKPLDGVSSTGEPTRTCPVCGKQMKNGKFSVLCDPLTGGCGFKINREIASKKLPASAIDALASGKPTSIIKGFKSKSGKSFEARLVVDKAEKKVAFDFGEKSKPAPTMTGRTCPACGGQAEDKGALLECSCGFRLWKTACGVKLTDNQLDGILAGKTIQVSGMKNKAGKVFNAGIKLSDDKKGTQFVFDKTKK